MTDGPGAFVYQWSADGRDHRYAFVEVAGTNGDPCLFGDGEPKRPIQIRSFLIGSNPVTQALWSHVMGSGENGDHTQPVARKAPNQLGIHDMSGNVWEWCQDVFTRDTTLVAEVSAQRVAQPMNKM